MNVHDIHQNHLSAYSNTAQAANSNTLNPTGQSDNTNTQDRQPDIIVSFSEEAKANTKEAKKTVAQELQEMQAQREALQRQVKNAQKQAEGMAEMFEVKRKCLLIAMRIMKGDKVPDKDHRYLAKNEPELYARAIMMKRYKEKPVKHKRVSEDEKESEDTSDVDEVSSVSTEIEAETASTTDDGETE